MILDYGKGTFNGETLSEDVGGNRPPTVESEGALRLRGRRVYVCRCGNKPELIRTTANKSLPVYSKINEVELVGEPFEKTPKMSIKRYLYR